MFQWMFIGSTSKDYPVSWAVAFDNKLFCCIATKNHDTAQYVAVSGQSITGLTIHASYQGTTFVLGLGY